MGYKMGVVGLAIPFIFYIVLAFIMESVGMAKVNLWKMASKSFKNSSIYVSIVEAIVNSIQAIEEKNNIKNGVISVKFIREPQLQLLEMKEESLPAVIKIEIEDNGVWFNKKNRESFSTVYSTYKQDRWGLWFWRISYLSFFDSIDFLSIYEEKNGEKKQWTWKFTGDDEFFNFQESISDKETKTNLVLSNIKQRFKNSIDKDFDVIVRRICEKLLGFYAFEYKLPKIVFEDSLDWKTIEYSQFLKETSKIKKIETKKDSLKVKETLFNISFIKVYKTQLGNSVHLCAHSRDVLHYSMQEIEKLFQDPFLDQDGKYSIQVYIGSEYFDQYVNSERNWFEFPDSFWESWLFFTCESISMEDILEWIRSILKEELREDYEERETRKNNIIDVYFRDNPYYSEFVQIIKKQNWGTGLKPQDIEQEISKLMFNKKQKVYTAFDNMKKGFISDEEEVNEIVKSLTEVGKIELSKYVVNRKKVIEILDDKLWYINQEIQKGNDSDFEQEKIVHSIIFPMKKDSEEISYFNHNLRLLDERLSFSEYISSDNSIEAENPHWDRADILCFQKTIAMREWEEATNPIVVFELKRPWRQSYPDNENPIKQVCSYINKIRSGSMKNYRGRNIIANINTPGYGFVVCDINSRIKEFAIENQLTPTPDWLWYVGYHNGYNVYLEIISWDKLIKDAQQRNKIFFQKLWIE